VSGRDSYHRERSLRMLEYICEHHLDDYNWFVRAVDDTYLRPDKLMALLSAIDKNRKVTNAKTHRHIFYAPEDLKIAIYHAWNL